MVKPHGVRGVLKIFSYAESEATFLKAGRIYLYTTTDNKLEEWEVISIRPQKGHFLMELKGLTDRDKAEMYRDAEIYINKNCLSREQGEFFWYELIGVKVFLVTGTYLGKISHILPTGSNDVYIVKREDNENEYLIPAIEDVIKEINLTQNRMIIEPLDGLMELNEKKSINTEKERGDEV